MSEINERERRIKDIISLYNYLDVSEDQWRFLKYHYGDIGDLGARFLIYPNEICLAQYEVGWITGYYIALKGLVTYNRDLGKIGTKESAEKILEIIKEFLKEKYQLDIEFIEEKILSAKPRNWLILRSDIQKRTTGR